MQTCKKCRKKMVPKIELNGEVAEILRKFATQVDDMRWTCPSCGAERASPLKASEVEEVKTYVRRQKKKWWQFWI